jgi:hypothetical protein
VESARSIHNLNFINLNKFIQQQPVQKKLEGFNLALVKLIFSFNEFISTLNKRSTTKSEVQSFEVFNSGKHKNFSLLEYSRYLKGLYIIFSH